MKKLLMGSVLAVVFLASSSVRAADKPPLDGTAWEITTGEKGKPQTDKETVTFKDGKFHSPGCDQYGFSASPYTAKVNTGATVFESEGTSAKEGKMKWKGTVTLAGIEGSYIWSKPGQKDIEYTFKGKKK